LPSSVADVDGNAEDRRGTVSVFNGPAPTIGTFDDPDQEAEAVAEWIADRVGEDVEPHEISCLSDRRPNFGALAWPSNAAAQQPSS
jgi:hypothetical protein